VGGAVAGVLAGFGATRLWPRDPILALLVFAAGVVAGRIYQRIVSLRICGDGLCRAPIGRAATCPSCGAQAADKVR
jgi:hypothetical protein